MNDGALLSRHIANFIDVQIRLLAEFRDSYPDATDWKMLFDFPKGGAISLEGVTWNFKRHGAGLGFVNQEDGIVVEAHVHIRHPELFDCWRIELYLESIGQETSQDILDAFLKAELEARRIKKHARYDSMFYLTGSR